MTNFLKLAKKLADSLTLPNLKNIYQHKIYSKKKLKNLIT